MKPVSTFEAAYRAQVGLNMFSGEAMDAVTPFLMDQVDICLNAYSLMNEVVDAYELTHGRGCGMRVRDMLDDSLEAVAQSFDEFYNRDRHVFIDMGTAEVHLKDQLLVKENFGNTCIKVYDYTPSYMWRNPMSAAQAEHLAAYVAAKGTTVFEYLVNYLKFNPVRYTDEEMAEATAQGRYLVRNVYPLDPADATRHIAAGTPYLAAGSQHGSRERDPERFLDLEESAIFVQAINMDRVGAGVEKLKVRSHLPKTPVSDLLFFLAA